MQMMFQKIRAIPKFELSVFELSEMHCIYVEYKSNALEIIKWPPSKVSVRKIISNTDV